MNAIELISQDLFDKVRSRYSNLEMGDEDGNVTSDPRTARFFDFDFTMEGTNLGRVSISINERGALKIFYGQGILEDTDPVTQDTWFNFLKEMRNFAKRRLLRFDTRDITKSNLDKNDFQYLAQAGSKEENNMAESKMFGSSKSSYLPLEKTRLIVRHNKTVDEEQRGSRSRNIGALYIENAEGERFKYPFVHLAGAKAMQRHVANGGRPYDDHGNAIIGMSEQIAQLSAFKRHVGKHDSMHQDANNILEKASMKLEGLRNQIAQLGKQQHYQSWKESFVPEQAGGDLDQATMENYKSTFTVSTFAEDLTQYFPLIHSIMKETGEVALDEYVGEATDDDICPECHESPCQCGGEKTVKEFAEFANWADAIVEGHLPDDVIDSLKDLIDNEADVGLDGTNAIQSLQGIGIHDSDLEDMINKAGPSGNLKTVVTMWLNQNGDKSALDQLGLNNADAEEPAATEPEVAPSTELEPAAGTDVEQPAEEGEGDMMAPEEEMVAPASPSLLEIAELVKSFYDRETKKFPLGTTGVVTKVRKEFGDKAGELAERLCNHLTGDVDDSVVTDEAQGEGDVLTVGDLQPVKDAITGMRDQLDAELGTGEEVSDEDEVDELMQPAQIGPEREQLADLGDKIKHLNNLYIRAKNLKDALMQQKIKERLVQLSAKKAELLQAVSAKQDAVAESAEDRRKKAELKDLKHRHDVTKNVVKKKHIAQDIAAKETATESSDLHDILKLSGLKK